MRSFKQHIESKNLGEILDTPEKREKYTTRAKNSLSITQGDIEAGPTASQRRAGKTGSDLAQLLKRERNRKAGIKKVQQMSQTSEYIPDHGETFEEGATHVRDEGQPPFAGATRQPKKRRGEKAEQEPWKGAERQPKKRRGAKAERIPWPKAAVEATTQYFDALSSRRNEVDESEIGDRMLRHAIKKKVLGKRARKKEKREASRPEGKRDSGQISDKLYDYLLRKSEGKSVKAEQARSPEEQGRRDYLKSKGTTHKRLSTPSSANDDRPFNVPGSGATGSRGAPSTKTQKYIKANPRSVTR